MPSVADYNMCFLRVTAGFQHDIDVSIYNEYIETQWNGAFENPSKARSRRRIMANCCDTNIDINTDSEKTAKAIYDKLEQWLKNPDGEPNGWLGCLAVNSGIIASYDDINKSSFLCRGYVEDITLNGKSINMFISTEWDTMMEVIYRALEKNFDLDGIDIIYSAEEPENGSYFTNDEDLAGTYHVDIYSDGGEQVLDAFGVEEEYVECYNCYNYSEKELIARLKKAFGIGDDENPTIEELLDVAAGHPGIRIDMWEYESLFDTF